MDVSTILRHVDHTLLRPTATWEEIQELCGEALRHCTASACIPPCYVERAVKLFGSDLRVCTVIGFPLGYHTPGAKLAETQTALADGAVEIDMVVNLTDVKNAAFDRVTAEITALKKEVGGNILKVIVEACFLTREEKIALCGCVTAGGADFIKTSTGFGSGGATLEDVALFREHIGPGVEIKASGGIRSRAEMEAFLLAGCSRLGTSSAIKALYANP